MAFFYPTSCLSYNRIKGAERGVNTVKNAGEEQEIEPHVDRFLVSEKKGDILAGKPGVLAGIEVHDQAADNEQPGDGKSGKNAHLLRFKYVVNFFSRYVYPEAQDFKCNNPGQKGFKQPAMRQILSCIVCLSKTVGTADKKTGTYIRH